VTLTLQDAGATTPTSATVSFGGVSTCEVQSLQTSAGGAVTLSCLLPRGSVSNDSSSADGFAAGTPAVVLQPFGLCSSVAAPTLDRRFVVTGVSPPALGTGGGGLLTVSGVGFSAQPGTNVVTLQGPGGVTVGQCTVTTATTTQLTCVVTTAATPVVAAGAAPPARRLSAALAGPLTAAGHAAVRRLREHAQLADNAGKGGRGTGGGGTSD
jgi:hypothetical protein